MKILLGTDIVCISRFTQSFQKSRDYFVRHVFLPAELEHAKPEKLAGIFAAKEATMKALGIQPGRWQEILVASREDGKPYLSEFPGSRSRGKRLKHELSIAHDGDYALATVVFYG